MFDAYVGSPDLGDARGSGSEFDLVEIIKNKIQYSDNRDLWDESGASPALSLHMLSNHIQWGTISRTGVIRP